MQEKSIQEDIKDKSVTEAANESKVEESPSTQKDEKKEKVKKKRSFRSFSFLRREKKKKEENNKNGDVAKEVSPSFVSILWCAKMETMARYWLVRPHALLFIPAVDACFPFQRPTNMHDGVIFFVVPLYEITYLCYCRLATFVLPPRFVASLRVGIA